MTKITDLMKKALSNHNYDFATDFKKLDKIEGNSYDIIFDIKRHRFELINQEYPNTNTDFVRLVGNLIYNDVDNAFWAILTDCNFNATDDDEVTMLLEMLVTKHIKGIEVLNQEFTFGSDSISVDEFEKQRENEIMDYSIKKLGQNILHFEIHFDELNDPRLAIAALLSFLHLYVEDEDGYEDEEYKYNSEVSDAIDLITLIMTTRTKKFSKKFLTDLSNLVDSQFELDDWDADDEDVLSYPAVKKLQSALHDLI